MPTINLPQYKQRLLQALSYYEGKSARRSRLHPQRRKDILYLRNCIQYIYDDVLLDRELTSYLGQLKTKTTWLSFFTDVDSESELRNIILTIMDDERFKYNQWIEVHKSNPNVVDWQNMMQQMLSQCSIDTKPPNGTSHVREGPQIEFPLT